MEFRNQKSRGGGSRSTQDADEGGGGRRYPTSCSNTGSSSSGSSRSYRDDGGARGARSKKRPDLDSGPSFRSSRTEKRTEDSTVKEYDSSKRSSGFISLIYNF